MNNREILKPIEPNNERISKFEENGGECAWRWYNLSLSTKKGATMKECRGNPNRHRHLRLWGKKQKGRTEKNKARRSWANSTSRLMWLASLYNFTSGWTECGGRNGWQGQVEMHLLSRPGSSPRVCWSCRRVCFSA